MKKVTKERYWREGAEAALVDCAGIALQQDDKATLTRILRLSPDSFVNMLKTRALRKLERRGSSKRKEQQP